MSPYFQYVLLLYNLSVIIYFIRLLEPYASSCKSFRTNSKRQPIPLTFLSSSSHVSLLRQPVSPFSLNLSHSHSLSHSFYHPLSHSPSNISPSLTPNFSQITQSLTLSQIRESFTLSQLIPITAEVPQSPSSPKVIFLFFFQVYLL